MPPSSHKSSPSGTGTPPDLENGSRHADVLTQLLCLQAQGRGRTALGVYKIM